MHIETAHFNINLGGGPIAAAALAAILGAQDDLDDQPKAPAEVVPTVGDRWPGVDGTFVGIGRDNRKLVLLDAKPPKAMNHDDMKAWAESVGGELPTRWEGALLYANLQGSFETDRWYWLLDESQSSSSYAWYQYFVSGIQNTYLKSYEGWGCAVRRF